MLMVALLVGLWSSVPGGQAATFEEPAMPGVSPTAEGKGIVSSARVPSPTIG